MLFVCRWSGFSYRSSFNEFNTDSFSENPLEFFILALLIDFTTPILNKKSGIQPLSASQIPKIMTCELICTEQRLVSHLKIHHDSMPNTFPSSLKLIVKSNFIDL